MTSGWEGLSLGDSPARLNCTFPGECRTIPSGHSPPPVGQFPLVFSRTISPQHILDLADCIQFKENVQCICKYLKVTAADTMNNMLISVSAAKWYILKGKNGTRFVSGSGKKYIQILDLVPGRKCLSVPLLGLYIIAHIAIFASVRSIKCTNFRCDRH